MPPPIRLSANLSWLFADQPSIVERMARAAARGFRHVEAMDAGGESPAGLAEAAKRLGLQFVLLNAPPCRPGGDLGVTSLPERRAEFRAGLATAAELCDALTCPLLHVMAGRVPASRDGAETRAAYLSGLREAVATMAPRGVTCVIEPISNVPDYFLNSYQEAVAIVKEVPGLRLLLDVYHLQMLEGSLASLADYLPLAGHVQIAQAPGRQEPGAPGDIDYGRVLGQIARAGYSGCVGLEYRPSDGSEAGLDWLAEKGFL